MGVRCEREGHANVVILDWPEQRNAMGPDEVLEFASVLKTAADDPAVHGVVITGNGAFCSGGNLKGAASRTGMPEEERRTIVYGAFQNMIRAVIAVPVPTVAAIDGPAIGMGFDIALACDSRFIGPDGWCLQGWGRVGFAPGTGGEWLLRLQAPDLLWRLLEEQPKIDASLAKEWRLAEPSAPLTARQRAIQRINRLAPMSRDALESYVELSRMELRRGLEEHLEVAVRNQLKLLASPAIKARIAQVLKKG